MIELVAKTLQAQGLAGDAEIGSDGNLIAWDDLAEGYRERYRAAAKAVLAVIGEADLLKK